MFYVCDKRKEKRDEEEQSKRNVTVGKLIANIKKVNTGC